MINPTRPPALSLTTNHLRRCRVKDKTLSRRCSFAPATCDDSAHSPNLRSLPLKIYWDHLRRAAARATPATIYTASWRRILHADMPQKRPAVTAQLCLQRKKEDGHGRGQPGTSAAKDAYDREGELARRVGMRPRTEHIPTAEKDIGQKRGSPEAVAYKG